MTEQNTQPTWVRGTRHEFESYLREALSPVDPSLRERGARVLFSKLATDPEQLDRGIHRSLNEEHRSYFVHGEDLQLVGTVASIAAAGAALLRDPVGLIGGLLVLLYRFRKNRVPLSPDEAAVLTVLAKSPPGGWTAETVTEHLVDEMEPAYIERLLMRLKTVRKENGAMTALVTELDGRWRVCDP